MTAEVVKPLVRDREGLRREGLRRLRKWLAPCFNVIAIGSQCTHSCGIVCLRGSDVESCIASGPGVISSVGVSIGVGAH